MLALGLHTYCNVFLLGRYQSLGHMSLSFPKHRTVATSVTQMYKCNLCSCTTCIVFIGLRLVYIGIYWRSLAMHNTKITSVVQFFFFKSLCLVSRVRSAHFFSLFLASTFPQPSCSAGALVIQHTQNQVPNVKSLFLRNTHFGLNKPMLTAVAKFIASS